jgi:hypothetical protein
MVNVHIELMIYVTSLFKMYVIFGKVHSLVTLRNELYQLSYQLLLGVCSSFLQGLLPVMDRDVAFRLHWLQFASNVGSVSKFEFQY